MSPAELKVFFDSRQLPKEVEWHAWSKIEDTERFLNSNFRELAEVVKRGDYTRSPAYWHLMDLKEVLERKEQEG